MKTFNELKFNFGKLTGRDHLAIENELANMGKMFVSSTYSGEFLRRMAARACEEKIGSDSLLDMSILDYNAIRNHARSFLARSGM